MARTTLEERDRELLQSPNFAHIATFRQDGRPHVVPLWVDADGDEVILNGVDSRAWLRNLRRDPRITLTVQNLENPYEYVEIRGQATDITKDGGEEHIDKLARKYLGRDVYPDHREDDPRYLVRVRPEAVRRAGS